MMKFICYVSKSFTTYVKVGGKNVQVCFCNSDANALGKGEVYIHGEDLQKAMLESKRYGVDWFSPDIPEVSEKPSKVVRKSAKGAKGIKDVSDKDSAELGQEGANGVADAGGVLASELSAEDLENLKGAIGVDGTLGVDGVKETVENTVSTEKEIVVVKSIPEARVILKERGFEGSIKLRCDAEKAAESLGFELQFVK